MVKIKIKLYLNNIISFTVFNLLQLIFFVFKVNPKNNKKILFVNFGQIGDLAITSMLYDIYEVDWNNISVLIDERFYNFLSYLMPNVEILSINLKKYKYNLLYRIKVITNLKKTHYDYIVNLTSFKRILTDEIVLLLSGNNYYCLKNNWQVLDPLFRGYFTKKYIMPVNELYINEYIRHLEIFNYLFKVKNSFKPTNIKTNKPATINFNKYIVVSPLSSQNISAWGINKYVELVSLLGESYNFVILGDRYLKEFDLGNNVLNLTGSTKLEEAIEVIRHSNFYIGNDSGLTHVALKYGIPLVCILGGGAFNFYFPIFEDEKTKYIYNKLDCFNCDWYCIYSNPKCLADISISSVYFELNDMLKKFYV